MKRTVAVLMVLMSVCSVARADEASKEKKIRELFEVTHVAETVQQARQIMVEHAHTLVNSTIRKDLPLTASEQGDVDAFLAAVVGLAAEQYDWKALEPKYVHLYASVYSEDELDGLLTFYRTPFGQSVLAKLPAINAGRLQLLRDKDKELDPKFKALFTEFMQRLEKDAEAGSVK